MTRILKQHKLNYEETVKYFKYNLEGLNTLSIELLNFIHFAQGSFFTLLPDNSNYDRLYEFEAGLVLPQNPEIEYFVSGRRCTYSHIPTIQDEIADFIVKQLSCNKNLSCVFDDCTETATSPEDYLVDDFYLNHVSYIYNKEVFYLIKKENTNLELIKACLQKSNATWHSLCILSTVDCKNIKNHKFTLHNIQAICANAEIILLGAYDGEGYVLWEKSNKATMKT